MNITTPHSKRVAIYARSATTRSHSLARQLRNCHDYVARTGAELVLAVGEVASGTNARRAGLAQVLSAAGGRRFDALLVEDISRLTRDCGLCLELERTLRAAGVQAICFEGEDQ